MKKDEGKLKNIDNQTNHVTLSFCRVYQKKFLFVEHSVCGTGRHCPVKGVNQCSAKGYQGMQEAMLSQGASEIECQPCQALLTQCKFKQEDLDEMVDRFLQGDTPARKEPRVVAAEEEDETVASLASPQQPKAQRGGNQAAECYEWAAALEPVITLLPAGHYGKRVPYRCTLCRTGKYPHGKIGECNELKLNSVKHFITNHIQSFCHQRNLRRDQQKMNPGGDDDDDEVDCEGIAVNDPVSGGALHIFRHEFGLWATMANFAEFAKHRYMRDANQDTWIIKSCDCKGQVSRGEFPPGGRPACSECKKLGVRMSFPFCDVNTFEYI